MSLTEDFIKEAADGLVWTGIILGIGFASLIVGGYLAVSFLFF